LEDVTRPNAHGIFEVTIIKAAMPAEGSGMQGIQALLQFLPVKEEALLHLVKLLLRGGITDVCQ
jgi:hypothetical protein